MQCMLLFCIIAHTVSAVCNWINYYFILHLYFMEIYNFFMNSTVTQLNMCLDKCFDNIWKMELITFCLEAILLQSYRVEMHLMQGRQLYSFYIVLVCSIAIHVSLQRCLLILPLGVWMCNADEKLNVQCEVWFWGYVANIVIFYFCFPKFLHK